MQLTCTTIIFIARRGGRMRYKVVARQLIADTCSHIVDVHLDLIITNIGKSAFIRDDHYQIALPLWTEPLAILFSVEVDLTIYQDSRADENIAG